MATIVLRAAGTFIGGFFGPVGAAIGSAVGSAAGYAIDRSILGGGRREGPRLNDVRPFTAEDGAPLARIYGTVRIGGTLIWATRFEETSQTERQGGKGSVGGGEKVTTYSYFANVAFALCEGPTSSVRRIWADGREIDQQRFEIRVHAGGEGQAPDPLISAKQGAARAPGYRGTAYVVFERFPLADYGNRVPQFHFEVIRALGSVAERMTAVAMIPGSTEYGLAPGLVTYASRPGATEMLNRHVFQPGSDFAASLDELQAICPNIEHVGLVTTWFGNDLRAGSCLIRPEVTQNTALDQSSAWRVSGVERADAVVVSEYDGSAAYGGSPSDRTIIEAIAEIKARGLKVALYPFIMMDVPHANALPDPYGGGAQAAYPWRGRITCWPGPGAPGSADKSADARTQVAAFCGTAASGDFQNQGDTVAFGGNPDDWGYRRFLLHFAHLAAAAGGVDAFLLGSEMRGLTTLRDGGNAFPFVEALGDLAGEVRAILGPGTKISYGADWSEYFGHQPDDGSGDVFFHLDPLWAHPAVDAIGIDSYMPVSDWRDEDYAGANPDGFATPYDIEGLRRSIAGGEGFDWYYASEEDRLSRLRTPITDGAYGRDWVFRFKDLASWWSEPHHDRVGGIESATPTAWVPQSKPIWLTELGCPASDKGTNQPNVFPDPKSSESFLPRFSSGGRSDVAQQRYLEANFDHWKPESPHYAGGNPVSPIYGGPMVDPSRIFVWAWDARPFPAFPLRGDIWGDGDNWLLGHWLNGRLSGITAATLIDAILADHGLPPADTRGVEGSLHGYVLTEPTSARAALEPVLDLFGLGANDRAGALVFAREGSLSRTPVELDELVVDPDGGMVRATRVPDTALPAELLAAFREPFSEYQTATAGAVHASALGRGQATISFPGVIEQRGAEALVADRLRDIWAGRETVEFSLPPGRVDVACGTLVRLAAVNANAEFIVTEVEDGLVRRVAARGVRRAPPTPWRVERPLPDPTRLRFPGAPLIQFLDLPMLPGAVLPHDQFRAAAWAEPWTTQVPFASPAGEGFVARATIATPATMGRLTAPLGPGYEGRIDRIGTIEVELAGGALSSVPTSQMLNGANAAAIRSEAGSWEVVQFQTAEEVAPSVWRLGTLLRGQSGTNDAMTAGAAAGADFVLLDGRVPPAGLQPFEAGLTLNWRTGPRGYDFSDAHFTQQSVAGGLRALTPLSPVHLKIGPAGDGGRSATWIRRGRIDADAWLATEIPLGEDREAYVVTISTPEGGTLRTAQTDRPSWTYPAAAIVADLGAGPHAFDLTVRQLSSAVGPGIPATIRVLSG